MLLQLVDRADVLVENFRTGVLERLGLGLETLRERNPRLVVLSVTGFGHDGPEGGRAGYDQIAQGEAGLMSLTGSGPDDPQRVGVPIADLLAGMYGAYGVLAALHERDRTGVGTIVRTSLLAATVGVHAFQGTRWTVAGEVGQAQGNHHPSIAPYGLFHCRDGSVQIAVGQRGTVATASARASASTRLTPGLATNSERVANRETRHRGGRAGLRRLGGRASAGATGRGRHPGRQGADASTRSTRWDQTASQGLLVDVEHAVAGAADAARPAAALLRGRRDRGDPQRRTRRRRRWTSTATSVRAWLQERRRHGR